MADKFWENYNKWYEDALEEAFELFPEETEETIGIHEDGTVDFSGNLWMCTEKSTVTPWEESEHYIDWRL